MREAATTCVAKLYTQTSLTDAPLQLHNRVLPSSLIMSIGTFSTPTPCVAGMLLFSLFDTKLVCVEKPAGTDQAWLMPLCRLIPYLLATTSASPPTLHRLPSDAVEATAPMSIERLPIRQGHILKPYTWLLPTTKCTAPLKPVA